MTIQTPTSNPLGAGVPHDVPQTLPAGLPDPATLARLATEFFAALPGGGVSPALPGGSSLSDASSSASFASALPVAAPVLSAASNPAPAGSPLAGPGGFGTGVPGAALPQGKVAGANLLPSAPTHVLSLGNRAPALVPHAAAQNGLPDSAVTIAPALEPRFGGAALGVPEGLGAQRPSAGGASASSAAASRYYFLDQPADTRYASHGGGQEIVVPSSDSVSAQSFGLPGEDELRSLLSVQRFPYDAGSRDSGSGFNRGGSRYFVEEAQPSADPARAAHGVPNAAASAHPRFDVNAIRRDFPILSERVNGRQLVWFDNAATTHKPQAVIDRLAYFYAHEKIGRAHV